MHLKERILCSQSNDFQSWQMPACSKENSYELHGTLNYNWFKYAITDMIISKSTYQCKTIIFPLLDVLIIWKEMGSHHFPHGPRSSSCILKNSERVKNTIHVIGYRTNPKSQTNQIRRTCSKKKNNLGE